MTMDMAINAVLMATMFVGMVLIVGIAVMEFRRTHGEGRWLSKK